MKKKIASMFFAAVIGVSMILGGCSVKIESDADSTASAAVSTSAAK